MTSEVFTLEITVPASAIDAQGHVNNLIYLEWCLQAAETHWVANTTEAQRARYVWFVLRHEIDYKTPAFQGETVLVRTWVHSADGVKSERRYQIERPSDGKTLVSASTLWCFLDASTNRPTKITEEIRTLF
ncbi:MAG: thioesterase family protein [Bacteroidota bacterium]